MTTSRKAIFLDKDGTLLYDVPYNVDPRKVVFREDAFGALFRLQRAGYRFFIISNQSSIALGKSSPNQLEVLGDYLVDSFRREGITLEGFYTCPHLPESRPPCLCRKPRPGMLFRAAREHRLSLEESWMVGDILDDVEAGNRAGCRTILLDVGSETVWKHSDFRKPDKRVGSLSEAADTILSLITV